MLICDDLLCVIRPLRSDACLQVGVGGLPWGPSKSPRRRESPRLVGLAPSLRPGSNRSFTSRGIGRQGVGSFCKTFLCFNTRLCRPMPLLVHFRNHISPLWNKNPLGSKSRTPGFLTIWLWGVACPVPSSWACAAQLRMFSFLRWHRSRVLTTRHIM